MITSKFAIIEELHDHHDKLQSVEGYIYVTGWINPDLSATGQLHLTSDKKNQLIYQWAARCGQSMKGLLLKMVAGPAGE